MNIKEFSEADQQKLNLFKEIEWLEVDSTHFDDKALVDFDEQEITYIAENDEKEILGYIKFKTEMGTCEIETLIVGKNFRKNGIASQLVSKVEEFCRGIKIHKIYLETGVDWEAKGFYEKTGYKTICVLKNHYAHKDFVLMEKYLY